MANLTVVRILTYCLIFLLTASESTATDIITLLFKRTFTDQKLSTEDSDNHYFEENRKWGIIGPSHMQTYCDRVIQACIVAVVSYMVYFIIALLSKPVYEEKLENAALLILLETHRFKDGNIPGPIRSLYDHGCADIHTSIGKKPLPDDSIEKTKPEKQGMDSCTFTDSCKLIHL